jgi:transposase
MAAFLGVTNDNIASAEEVSLAIEQQDKKLQKAMKELKSVSHAGSYQQWLTNYKTFLAELKSKNPIGYQGFMEQFTSIKNQLKSKGVLQ